MIPSIPSAQKKQCVPLIQDGARKAGQVALDKVPLGQEAMQEFLGDGKALFTAMTEVIMARMRMRSGGDDRIRQATILWEKGWGRELGVASLEAYLATIPPVPEWPVDWTVRFDRTVLVDARLALTTSCRLAGLGFPGNDSTLVPFDPAKTLSGVYWMCCHDGRRNRNKAPRDCRASFASAEVGLTDIEGVAIYAQDPTVIEGHYMDLPGSVRAEHRESVACLGLWDGRPGLDWYWDDGADPYCGSASRGSVKI